MNGRIAGPAGGGERRKMRGCRSSAFPRVGKRPFLSAASVIKRAAARFLPFLAVNFRARASAPRTSSSRTAGWTSYFRNWSNCYHQSNQQRLQKERLRPAFVASPCKTTCDVRRRECGVECECDVRRVMSAECDKSTSPPSRPRKRRSNLQLASLNMADSIVLFMFMIWSNL
jgi:hypothetical protein